MESDSQVETIVNLTGLSSILSVIGVIAVIILVIKLKTQSYYATLLLYLSFSELIFAISTLGNIHKAHKVLLTNVLGFFLGFGFYSKIFWTNCILIHSCLTINYYVRTRKYEMIAVWICFGIPLASSALVLLISEEAFTALLPGSLAGDSSTWLFKLIPMGLTIILFSVIGTMVILKLAKEGFYLTRRGDEAQNARDFLIFPLILVVTWIPSLIYMIGNWKEGSSGRDTPHPAIAAIDGTFFGLQGFCNAVFYCSTFEIREKVCGRRRNNLSARLLDEEEAPRHMTHLTGISLPSSLEEQDEIENTLARAIPSLSRSASQRRGFSRRDSYPCNISGLQFPSRQISQIIQESNENDNQRMDYDRFAVVSTPEFQDGYRDLKRLHSCSEDNIVDKSRTEGEDETRLVRRPTISVGEKTASSHYNLRSTKSDFGAEEERQEMQDNILALEEPTDFLDKEQRDVEFIRTNIPFKCSFTRKTMKFQPDPRIVPFQKCATKVAEKLEAQGLAEMGVVFGIDCTSSNATSGKISFGGRPLHHISEVALNFYEQVIAILGSVAYKFSRKKHFPVYLFGDSRTRGYSVRPLYIDPDGESHECYGVRHILHEYRQQMKNIKLSGPSYFKPLIEKAIEIVEVKGDFEVLVIITDGEPTDVEETRNAIIKAAEFPLEIIVVGVGDGNIKTYPRDPWFGMKNFEKSLPGRNYENFTFVPYEKGMSPEKFAEQAFKNVPSAYLYSYENELVEEKADSFHSV